MQVYERLVNLLDRFCLRDYVGVLRELLVIFEGIKSVLDRNKNNYHNDQNQDKLLQRRKLHYAFEVNHIHLKCKNVSMTG